MGGCLNRPIEPVEPRTTSTVVERLTESSVDKIDLLLMIDNSRSMADKQQILADAVPDLVAGLVNPKCVNQDTGKPLDAAMQPTDPTAMCPAGSKREFEPIVDIHIGIISSSIGGHGSDACPNSEKNATACPGGESNTTNNDMGRLLSRVDPCKGGVVPTFNNLGFLAWDPENKYGGETQIGDLNGNPGLVPTLRDLVIGVGQVGCGYEASLEAWYRFLVDPTPYDHIELDVNGRANGVGTDNTLLQQRVDFLRSSSLLAIIMLTDENDCSIKESGQYYLAAQQRDANNKQYYLPPARSECDADPNDKCCSSCGLPEPDGCPANAQDPKCAIPNNQQTDHANLRCWDQKRRFGIDFLYSTDRYVKGLTSLEVQDRNGAVVPNPIFSKLNPDAKETGIREPGLVFLAGIVGVPWQDIARRNEQDQPDLLNGKNADGDVVGGFKTAAELSAPDKDGHTVWDYILGDPANNKKPLDPHMVETTDPRSGTDPLFPSATIAPPGSPNGTDPINGHEYTVGIKNGMFVAKDDLQYACIFDLPPNAQRHCYGMNLVSCDCTEAGNDNPLCEPDPTNPNDPTARTHQVRAKGYPGIRELQVLRGLETQGIVASVCPVQVNDPASNDYGYRPAIGAIIDRLKTKLGNQCLPRTLTPDNAGQVPCLILEGRNSGGNCTCDEAAARQPVADDHKAALQDKNLKEIQQQNNLDCFCEITQLSAPTRSDCDKAPDSELAACQCDTADQPQFNGANVNGWCYVDATTNPPTGNDDLVATCPPTEKRQIRFVGLGKSAPNSVTFITCSGE